MIVIKVELHSAITGEVTQIAEGKIWNMGGDDVDAVYNGSFAAQPMTNPKRHLIASYAESVEHKRTDHVWKLVAKALARAFE